MTQKTPTSSQSSEPERIILGIDPGTTIMGYGIIRTRGKGHVELVEMGALHLGKFKDHALKLKKIFDRVTGLIDAHAPDASLTSLASLAPLTDATRGILHRTRG